MQRYWFTALMIGLLAGQLSGQDMSTPAENVFIITLDGLRWEEVFGGIVDSMVDNRELTGYQDQVREQFGAATPEERRARLLPFFWNTIGSQGMLLGNRWQGNHGNITNFFWFSYPGYNEILTGYSDPRINSNNKLPNPNVTVLEWLNQQPSFAGRVAAFGSWDVFDYIINEERSGIPVNCGYDRAEGDQLTEHEQFLNELSAQAPLLWNSVRPDFLTHNYMMEYLRRQHPRVVYISYGETDDFAHDGSYNRYLYSAHQTDHMIGQLWDYLQSDPVYAGKTTLLITTDHGRGHSPMTEWKSHGKTYDGSNAIWFAGIGPGMPAQGEVRTAMQWWQNQIAKSAAACLGLDYSSTEEEVGPVLPGVMAE
ncbi:MAG: phosphoglyceromutase [Lewinella sp.]|nr:phosphoglyceromutase [Lewinella sp.]